MTRPSRPGRTTAPNLCLTRERKHIIVAHATIFMNRRYEMLDRRIRRKQAAGVSNVGAGGALREICNRNFNWIAWACWANWWMPCWRPMRGAGRWKAESVSPGVCSGRQLRRGNLSTQIPSCFFQPSSTSPPVRASPCPLYALADCARRRNSACNVCFSSSENMLVVAASHSATTFMICGYAS